VVAFSGAFNLEINKVGVLGCGLMVPALRKSALLLDSM
jgi:hypothetical protein